MRVEIATALVALKNEKINGITIDREYGGHIDCLKINFETEKSLLIYDDGQDCCEHRFMNSDDDLDNFIGGNLLDIRLNEVSVNQDDSGTTVECQFLIIATSNGDFTVVNYNEHNGYYGGFDIVLELI